MREPHWYTSGLFIGGVLWCIIGALLIEIWREG